MANKLISAQATATIAHAGVQDGAPSAYGTATNIQCVLKSWSASKGHSTVNLAALCDTEEQLQIIRASGKVELEAFVLASSGPQWYSYEGYYTKVIITPVSGGSTLTFEGVMTDWGYSGATSAEQTEKCTITIGTNGV